MKTLLVDDSAHDRDVLRRALDSIPLRQKLEIHEADSADEALSACERWSPQLIFLDLRLHQSDSECTKCREVLAHVSQSLPDTPVILMSNVADDETVQSVFNGASQLLRMYIPKREGSEFVETVRFALRSHFGSALFADEGAQTRIIAYSDAMRDVMENIRKWSKLTKPILLGGDPGTGKTLIASFIHESSQRQGSFLKLTCGTLGSRDAANSQLFGAEKGRFSGVEESPGLFEAANKGTLFFDEVGDLTLEHQQMLLTVIETGQLIRVGSTKPIDVDVKVVAATWKNLQHEVEEGRFREDLWERFQGFSIDLPKLEERPEDLEPLVFNLLAGEVQKAVRGEKLPGITDEALCKLRTIDWSKGEIRTLVNVLTKAALNAEGLPIGPDDIEIPRSRSRSDQYRGRFKSLTFREAQLRLFREHVETFRREHPRCINKDIWLALEISEATFFRWAKESGLNS